MSPVARTALDVNAVFRDLHVYQLALGIGAVTALHGIVAPLVAHEFTANKGRLVGAVIRLLHKSARIKVIEQVIKLLGRMLIYKAGKSAAPGKLNTHAIEIVLHIIRFLRVYGNDIDRQGMDLDLGAALDKVHLYVHGGFCGLVCKIAVNQTAEGLVLPCFKEKLLRIKGIIHVIGQRTVHGSIRRIGQRVSVKLIAIFKSHRKSPFGVVILLYRI